MEGGEWDRRKRKNESRTCMPSTTTTTTTTITDFSIRCLKTSISEIKTIAMFFQERRDLLAAAEFLATLYPELGVVIRRLLGVADLSSF